MTNATDNIGSYKTIELIARQNVHSITEDATGDVTISMTGTPVDLPFQRLQTRIDVQPKSDNAGTTYENNASIVIPQHKITEALAGKLLDAAYSFSLLRYTTQHGEAYLVGGTDYPLELTIQKNHPGSVTGLSGWVLELKGKADYPQRKIRAVL